MPIARAPLGSCFARERRDGSNVKQFVIGTLFGSQRSC